MFPRRMFNLLKRFPKAQLPTSAPLGEPIFASDSAEIWVGQGIGQPLVLSSGSAVEQTSKLNITASQATPYVVDIPVDTQDDYTKAHSPTVIYLDGNVQDVVTTVCAFDNGDASSFNAPSTVVFDGTMKLNTVSTVTLTDQGAVGAGKMFSVSVDMSQYSKLTKAEVI